jgi:hypothetical protein
MKSTEQFFSYDPNSCSSSGGGSNGCGSCSTPAPAPTPTPTPAAAAPIELHVCAGLNACKGHDRLGTNDCAGMGMCATVAHVCHALNNCRGQGGCGLYGSGAQQNVPGENTCSLTGSCASPIQMGRLSTLGPNKDKSVWERARLLFEERMKAVEREFGPAPFPEGPTTFWLQSLGPFDACGSSGDPNCSFGSPKVLCGQKISSGNL